MEAALSTPATEPQGYAEVTEEMVTAGRIAADDKYYKWRGLGTREEGQGLDGMHFIVREAINKALAARPAPQPAAEHEYPDPLIAEDRYEDDQPAVDTRVVASLLDPNAVHLNMLRGTIAMPSVSQIKHIYGDALTPAPSDKIAEAARVLLDDLSAALGTDGGEYCRASARRWSVASDAAEAAPTAMYRPTPVQMIRAALRALAGKGE